MPIYTPPSKICGSPPPNLRSTPPRRARHIPADGQCPDSAALPRVARRLARPPLLSRRPGRPVPGPRGPPRVAPPPGEDAAHLHRRGARLLAPAAAHPRRRPRRFAAPSTRALTPAAALPPGSSRTTAPTLPTGRPLLPKLRIRPAKFRRSPSPFGDPRRPHRYSDSSDPDLIRDEQ